METNRTLITSISTASRYIARDSNQNQFTTIFSFKDTLLAGGTRVYFSKPTIKGDVDFIFGSASAVFENAQIIGRGDRRDTVVVFAPNTDNSQKYGYLVVNSKITADNSVKAKLGLHLARSWDSTSSEFINNNLK